MNLDLGDTRLILRECRRANASREETAYILATGYWETAKTMKPVREAFWLSDTWRRENLRYYPWYGRGYVQLTWEENYERAGAKLGLDLTTDPDVVMKPEIAARILVVGMLEGWFTGKPLSRYINERKVDYWNARRVVNGMDKAATIANLAEQYFEVLPAQRESFITILLRLLFGGSK
jgi:hypothetical protein